MEKLKIDIDSLIINYMIYKAENGYDLSFTYQEFMDFIKFSKDVIYVIDYLEDASVLFKRFMDKKINNGWYRYSQERFQPHIDIQYDTSLKDHVLKANYDFSYYDMSIVSTYHWGEYKLDYLKDIIFSYLENTPKRKLNDNYLITDYEKNISKCASGLILSSVWNNFIDKQINIGAWPYQCRDINRYLFEIDLSSIIDVKSINDELLALYQDFSKRFAILYHYDNNLKVSSYKNSYLERSNYDILIQGYQDLMKIGPYGKAISIDFNNLSFIEDHDKHPKFSNIKLDSVEAKKLVKNIESKIS